jgi:hypothetical protein
MAYVLDFFCNASEMIGEKQAVVLKTLYSSTFHIYPKRSSWIPWRQTKIFIVQKSE